MGSPVVCQDNDGCTPMHYAAATGQHGRHSGVLRAPLPLLAQEDPYNERPRGEQWEKVAKLDTEYERGRVSGAPTAKGEREYTRSRDQSRKGREYTRSGNQSFAFVRQVAAVVELHRLGCPVTCVAHDGSKPLHAAAASGQLQCVEQLISIGCPADVTAKDLSTPMHRA
eukprot:7897440-Pyramimonas_sp.AAC.1